MRGKSLYSLIAMLSLSFNLFSQSIAEFKNPDPSYRPITYWMFQNGNITKQGITKDLEAMKTAGVNGTLFFSVGMFKPGPVSFMSAPWWECVAHAIKESDRLKMKFGVYNSDGWSMSGGPWITPEESMKRISWADTTITGGKMLSFKLPQPEVNLLYEDVSVIAFPAIKNDAEIKGCKVISSSMMNTAAAGFDGNNKSEAVFLKPEGEKIANMVLDFGKTTPMRRVVFDEVKNNPFLDAKVILEKSDNGTDFVKVVDDFPLNLKAESTVRNYTLNFPQIETRYLRLSLTFVSSAVKPVVFQMDEMGIAEIKFYQSPRINLWEPKSGQIKRIRHDRQSIFMKELNDDPAQDLPADFIIDQKKQINLTKFIDKDGVLNWDAPKGEWIIQRVGYTSTNRMVGPATKDGRGLECNKMDAKAVEKHFNSYTAKINDLSVKLLGKPLDYMQMESWEAGIQNWTKGFEIEFEKRNGYSILPFLPVLAGGYVVNSYEESNKFLWDFRNTSAQLIAENYWGTMYKSAKALGITVSGEGSGMQHYLYDPMRYQQFLDIPMGEFWPNEGHSRPDVKSAASVANTYGRALSGGESFTSGDVNLWSVTPFKLKQIGDEAFTLGLNFLVLHTYVHQPYDVAPGFTLAKFGNHLQRLNPWYTEAKGWFNYFARSQYLLRQGKQVQDIAYFIGEGIPSYLGMSWEVHPKLPQGYDYDGVNFDIIKLMTVKNGEIFLPSGAHYKLLVFQDITKMTPELLVEIKRLLLAGAHIVSLKPSVSPSLTSKSADKELAKLAKEIWGDGEQSPAERTFGKGKIYSGVPLDKILSELNSIPDFIYTSADTATKINYLHRKSATSDIYFLANYEMKSASALAKFRANGKVPELWDPDKGTSKKISYRMIGDNQIEVPLTFEPQGSYFVVFKDPLSQQTYTGPALKEVSKQDISSGWQVDFNSHNQSHTVSLNKLIDWSESADPKIKYFSGSATYSRTFDIKSIAGKVINLDLGDVRNHNLATVKINEKDVSYLWKPPYKTDISSFVKEGTNTLEIKVTNTATNSLIGDERFASDYTFEKNALIGVLPNWLTGTEKRPTERRSFVTYNYLTKESKLDPSGIIGPVSLTINELVHFTQTLVK